MGAMSVILPKDHEVASIRVISPTMPENMDALLKEGPVELAYQIVAEASPAFDEWAKENGIPYTIEMHDEGILIQVEIEEHLLWTKMRWT